ncbi:MAG: hypothetical protein HKN44_16255 [Ilumatobacter sp.]|nr:hypothetical protein [Ilumatobacter sp.]
MGLFRRKTADPRERDDLLAEIELLRQRLDEADLQKDRLYAKLHVVAETSMGIDERVRSLDHAREQFDDRLDSIDEARLALDDRVGMISSTSAELHDRLGYMGDLSCKVQELSSRLTTAPPTVPPPPPPVRDDPRVDALTERLALIETKNQEIDDLHQAIAALTDGSTTDASEADDDRLTDLAGRLDDVTATLETQRDELAESKAGLEEIDAMRTDMASMTSKVSSLDSRMRSISFELTNQLTELSDDLQRLLDRPDLEPGPQIDPDQLQFTLNTQIEEKVGQALGAIHQSTERLAAEQARYEIKFREDLAELAERLRRPALH